MGFLIFCLIVGLIVGFGFSDWKLGAMIGIFILLSGVSLVLVSVFFALICIPPMILIDKWTGRQKTYKEKSNK